MGIISNLKKNTGRLYAIGDVHGCADELCVLIDHLRGTEKITDEDTVIFLGDYIDRGPDSKGVIDNLIEFQKEFSSTIFLKGNHEDMFLDYMGFRGRVGDSYLDNGGRECLESYGLSEDCPRDLVAQNMPHSHVEFYLSLDSCVVSEKFVFVHAGVNPLYSLEGQFEDDLLWIREGFIDRTHSFGKVIVFGHTPFARVFVDYPFKIGLDTGLVFGNRLSCLEVTSGEISQIERNSLKLRRSLLPVDLNEPLSNIPGGGVKE